MGYMKESNIRFAEKMKRARLVHLGKIVPAERIHFYRIKAYRLFAAREYGLYQECAGRKRTGKEQLREMWWQMAVRMVRPDMTVQEIRDALLGLRATLSQDAMAQHREQRISIKLPASAMV